jgi:hypothetical protein
MREVDDAATLVTMVDFFMKMAEATCSIVCRLNQMLKKGRAWNSTF